MQGTVMQVDDLQIREIPCHIAGLETAAAVDAIAGR